MVDQIHQAIDVIIPCMDIVDGSDGNKTEKIIDISRHRTNGRPLYLIKRNKYTESVRKQLKAKYRLLLKSFNTYAFYSCGIVEMQEKVCQHMTSTGAYSLMMEFNETNQHYIKGYLDKIDKQLTSTLDNLLQNRLITPSQRERLKVNQPKRDFNSLYFQPDTRRKNVPFHPMIKTRHDLIMKLSRFLHQLLQPVYDRATHRMSFETGSDVIEAIEEYTKKGFLRSNTLFVTLHIDDLSTIFPHEPIIAAVQHFLHEYVKDGRIQGITIYTVAYLVRLFLENQYVLYDNKLFRQIRGSSFKSPVTTVLSNIYLYYWQQSLLTILNNRNEVFGRCFDKIFLTWNESEDSLWRLLNMLNSQYPEMKMSMTVNNNVNYLDVNISHINGDLKTQVAHDLNTDPYALPYVFGHTRHQYQTLPRATFFRAIRCYANVSDFASELEYMEFSFQYNRFPKNFLMHKFQLFLQEFNSTQLQNLFYCEPFYTQSLYDYLRQKVFNYNQDHKKVKLKRFQRQTPRDRWKRFLNNDRQSSVMLHDVAH